MPASTAAPERVREHRAVERKLQAYVRPIEPEHTYEGESGASHRHAERTAGEREQQRLDEHHAKNPLAAGTESRAYRKLLAARREAREL